MADRCAAGTLIEWGKPCSLCGNRSADGCGRDGEAWAAKDTALAEALATIARLTALADDYKSSDRANYAARMAAERRGMERAAGAVGGGYIWTPAAQSSTAILWTRHVSPSSPRSPRTPTLRRGHRAAN